ncbi:hypothetical protein B0O79_0159 [Flavobacteriaceae bacterium MAR_2009_75]|nr:hypothetical protein B0O79_0159 [Flavobacteriaceae bacterium MAR_2009_75]
MKFVYFFSVPISIAILTACNSGKLSATNEVVFSEVDGILAVEAESFYKQEKDSVRKWYVVDGTKYPNVGRDDDQTGPTLSSGGTHLEILPDTRVTHDDKLIVGENFSNDPGKMGILYYKVNFSTLGRYYVWVRAHSIGSEDNGIHVGLNGKWPESGQRMQWCDGKGEWRWESKQRTEALHCGEPWKIYLDIDKIGNHEIMFSMREDGFEFDKFVMVKDTIYKPLNTGPKQRILSKKN